MAGEDLIVGLDVGTTKVCVTIARLNMDGHIEILGIGTSPSFGCLRQGVIIKMEPTMEAIAKAVESAELIAGFDVTSLYAGLGGFNIEGMNSQGIVSVNSKNREITQLDIERVLEQSKAVYLSMDREILHTIPREYTVDLVGHIKNPLAMMGVRLEADVHIMTGTTSANQNLIRCVNRAGFGVIEVVLSSWAAANLVITAEEKEMGCIFIDMGAGTTDIIIFSDGAPCHTLSLRFASERITQDIMQVWKLTEDIAEEVKIKAGAAHPSVLGTGPSQVLLPSYGSRAAQHKPRAELVSIIESRVTEIFSMIQQEIEKKGLSSQINGGVILTGGGALLPGIDAVAEKVFDQPARIGYPLGLIGLSEEYMQPQYASVLGIVHYAAEKMKTKGPMRERQKKQRFNIFKDVAGWFKDWF